MSLLDRLLRRRPAHPSAEAPRPRRPAGAADSLPPAADTLVVYALDDGEAAPDSRTPCMVVLDFDPVDVQQIFAASAALERAAIGSFRARLDAPGPLRDPNSRGRLHFVRRWLADHDPAWVGWRLEPAETAGSGAGD